MSLIPVVDVGCLRSSDATLEQKKAVANEIMQAMSTIGAFYIVNHGLSEEYMQSAFHAADQFFSLPEHVKKGIPIQAGGFPRGYVSVGAESGSQRLECKESFCYGYEWPSDVNQFSNSMQGQNVWPPAEGSTNAEWRANMTQLFTNLVQVTHIVARGLSLALGFEEDKLSQLCADGDTISMARLFHYFPYSTIQDSAKEKIGSSPHTDWGFLTLVLQDSCGGLEVFYNNEWQAVPPVENSLVVNCGDFLALLTQGRVHSPLHRVRCGETNRKSIVFFYYPSFETKLSQLANSQQLSILCDQRDGDGERAAKGTEQIDGVPFGEFIQRKWDQVFRGTSDYRP